MRIPAPAWMLGFAIATAPAAAWAQAARPPYIVLLPARPTAGELVVLRHEIAECIDQEVRVESIGPSSLRVTIVTSDTCERAVPARVALHDLGRFPAGFLDIQYVACEGLPPPPFDACRPLGAERIAIGGGLLEAVPLFAPRVALVFALGMLVTGLAAVRARAIRTEIP